MKKIVIAAFAIFPYFCNAQVFSSISGGNKGYSLEAGYGPAGVGYLVPPNPSTNNPTVYYFFAEKEIWKYFAIRAGYGYWTQKQLFGWKPVWSIVAHTRQVKTGYVFVSAKENSTFTIGLKYIL